MEVFLIAFVGLFSVINPLGTVPIFLGLTQGESKSGLRRIALWTALNVLIILTVSFFIGQVILNFFGINIEMLKIAGGIVICLSGFGLLSGSLIKQRGINKKITDDAQHRNDIALTPLAIPIMAGPGSMSLLIAMYQDYSNAIDKIAIVMAIVALSLIIYVILISAQLIARVLGESGILAISRIIGFLVIAIGIQYIVTALLAVFREFMITV